MSRWVYKLQGDELGLALERREGLDVANAHYKKMLRRAEGQKGVKTRMEDGI